MWGSVSQEFSPWSHDESPRLIMPTLLTASHFKEMAWKNGGGKTSELYKIPHPENSELFVFRLSKAHVSSSGPFSLFPGIERSLILLSGEGFTLLGPETDTVLSRPLQLVSFRGEAPIDCSLIKGPCHDFNIMIDRLWGSSKVSILEDNLPQESTFKADCDLMFIYDINHHTLLVLKQGETNNIKHAETSALIIVEVTLK